MSEGAFEQYEAKRAMEELFNPKPTPPKSEVNMTNKDTIKEVIGELVRDVTKVGSVPKSEARRRIMEVFEAGKKEGRKEVEETIQWFEQWTGDKIDKK